MMVSNVRETLDFYMNILGFELGIAVTADSKELHTTMPEEGEIVYGSAKKDAADIMFQAETNMKEDVPVLTNANIGASVTFYIEVDNVDEWHEKVAGKVNILKEPFDTWYGMREMYITDNNGYILCFGQQVV